MNKYHVVEEGGTYREFEKSHEGLEEAINFAWEISSDVLCNTNGVAETIWSSENVEITWIDAEQPSGKAGDCKSLTRRFDSDLRVQNLVSAGKNKADSSRLDSAADFPKGMWGDDDPTVTAYAATPLT